MVEEDEVVVLFVVAGLGVAVALALELELLVVVPDEVELLDELDEELLGIVVEDELLGVVDEEELPLDTEPGSVIELDGDAVEYGRALLLGDEVDLGEDDEPASLS